MGKNASLKDVQRAQIVTLHQEGYSERKISLQLSFSKTAVHNAISKFENSGSFSDKKRSGRPRKTSARDDNCMRRIIMKSPTSSCRKVRSRLLNKGTIISLSTVSRRLSKEFGLRSYKPAHKPKLTEPMKKKRLDFAKKHQVWNAEDWGNVLFSDESTFQQFVVRRQHVRRPVGDRFKERYTIPTMKHPPSQMIWGAMSKSGTAGLYFLPPKTTMNGAKYLELLRQKVQLHMEVHRCTIFMHDGAPCHRSKIVTDYLASQNIQVLEWPGNSPDLNPIENLWSTMKDKVAERQPSSQGDLVTVIKQVWTMGLSKDLCAELVASMPRRIQAVIDSKGGNTKY